jgi:hypothetical protein
MPPPRTTQSQRTYADQALTGLSCFALVLPDVQRSIRLDYYVREWTLLNGTTGAIADAIVWGYSREAALLVGGNGGSLPLYPGESFTATFERDDEGPPWIWVQASAANVGPVALYFTCTPVCSRAGIGLQPSSEGKGGYPAPAVTGILVPGL